MYQTEAFLTTSGDNSKQCYCFLPLEKPQSAIKGSTKRPKRASKTHLLSNAWRLIDSQFDKLNVLFPFSIEA
jgi:hypothetical protein